MLSTLSDLYIVIPARNEEQSIVNLIPQLKLKTKNILIVDNNSTDDTYRVAKEAGVYVIKENNIGYGSACLASIKYLNQLDQKPKFICFFDGDGQSRVKDIDRIALPVLANITVYCQGSRMSLIKSKMALSPLAQVANKIFSIILILSFQQKITDLGPLRVMTWEFLKSLDMRSKGYGWTIEMSSKLLKMRVAHLEIPVQYQERKEGKSKISGQINTAIMAAIVMLLTYLYVFFLWKPNRTK